MSWLIRFLRLLKARDAGPGFWFDEEAEIDISKLAISRSGQVVRAESIFPLDRMRVTTA